MPLRNRNTNTIPAYRIRGGGFDSDAQAFIDAAGITGKTQQEGLNTYVLSLKSSGVWDKLDAIYPMCPIDGSTATEDSAKYNLKDPRDLDAAFRITWNNSPTVTVNGVQGNGSNQYGDTNYNVNSNALLNNHCLGFVGNISGNNMGATSSVNNPYNSFFSTSFWSVNSGLVNIASSFSDGFVLTQRTASNAMAIYDDSSTASATSTQASSSKPNFNYFLLARNVNGSPSGYSNTLYNHFFFGKSLTEEQIGSFISAINTFNTTVR